MKVECECNLLNTSIRLSLDLSVKTKSIKTKLQVKFTSNIKLLFTDMGDFTSTVKLTSLSATILVPGRI
jgi:hypothetical protein